MGYAMSFMEVHVSVGHTSMRLTECKMRNNDMLCI